MHAVGVTQASYSSCPPLLNVRVAHVQASHYCPEFNSSVLHAVKDLGITRVLLAGVLDGLSAVPTRTGLCTVPRPVPPVKLLSRRRRRGRTSGTFQRRLQRTVHALQSIGVEIWIMRQAPTQSVLVPLALSRAALRGRDYADMGITLAQYRRSQGPTDALFDALGELRAHD